MLDQRKELDCFVYTSLGFLLLIYSNEAIRISQLNPTTTTTTTTVAPFLHQPPTTGSLWSTQRYHGIGGPFGHRPPNRTITTTTTTTSPILVPVPVPAPVSVPLPVPDLDRAPQCGVDVGSHKITGGKTVPRGRYPWMVSIARNHKHVCGGSLIDSQHVLTAAHCLFNMPTYNVSVILGDHDLSTTTEAQHQVRKIKRVLFHKGYREIKFSWPHDIALFLLDKPVEFSVRISNIAPVCLANEDDYGTGTGTGIDPMYDTGGTYGIVAGWGSEVDNGPEYSTLQHVAVPIWTNKDCAERYGANAPYGITDYQLCAGSEGVDSCTADSGGPLVIQRSAGEPFVQIGIVSWGIGCGGKYPSVYTRVSKYRDWIEQSKARLLVHF